MSSPMARERLEITDVDGFNSETKLTTENKLLKSGCYVSTLLGFVFVMLAVAIAVGVGVIVYFASGREVICQCGSSEVSSIDVISPLEMRKCVRLAEKKDHKVCKCSLLLRRCNHQPSSLSTLFLLEEVITNRVHSLNVLFLCEKIITNRLNSLIFFSSVKK